MSKNTKIIAIAGGVLILALILFSALTEGGCGETVNVWRGILGCKKGAPAATEEKPKKEEAKPAETADDESDEADEPEPKTAPADEEAEEGGEEGADDDDDDDDDE